MKIVLFASALGLFGGVFAQAQTGTLVPAYKIDCEEISDSADFKRVTRDKTETGVDLLQVQDMHLGRVQKQKRYSLSVGGIDEFGNRMLQAEEISFNMGLRHERAILTLSAESRYREATLQIYLVINNKLSNLQSEHSLICK